MAYRYGNVNNRGNRRGRGNFSNTVRGGSNNVSGYGQQNTYVRRPIGYKKLEELVNDDSILASDIALLLSTENSGFNFRLRSPMDNGMVQMLLKVFGKMCKEDEESSVSLIHVLNDILESDYMTKLSTFLYGIHSEPEYRKNNATLHVSNCLFLVKQMLAKLPKTSIKKVGVLMLVVENVMKLLDTVDWSLHGVEDRFDEVKEMIEDLSKKPEKVQSRQQKIVDRLTSMHDQQPPNDFRLIPVFPQINDIHIEEDPFVRTNLVNSKYNSVNHYLDVHFRLIREDFIRPLRDGIKQYFQAGNENQKVKKLQNIKMYEEVAILFPVLTHKGICHPLRFSTKYFKKIRWENTKRLMYGNLVCLSSDNFKRDFLFGVISDRKAEDLANGLIEVEFVFEQQLLEQHNFRRRLNELENNESDSDEETLNVEEGRDDNDPLSLIDMKKTYLMIETEAYFEAYRHILSGLQEIREIPLNRYIIECVTTMRAPFQFRQNQIQLDFSSILFDTEIGEKTAGIIDIDNWPTKEELRLDTSQRKALISGVTNELSVIQGPPGTGKTYVGLLIMKLLLANLPKIPERQNRIRFGPNIDLNHSPMLVVCYTNHALDQFLEGIIKFHPERLVRVGGRSKTEELDQYSLMNVKKMSSFNYRKRTSAIWNHKNHLQHVENNVRHQEDVLKVSIESVLKLEQLSDVIPNSLLDQFKNDNNRLDNNILIQWLELYNENNILSQYPHVYNEVLNVVTQKFAHLGMPQDFAIDAIRKSGETDPDMVLNWIYDHEHDSHMFEHVITLSDAVMQILSKVYVPNFRVLQEFDNAEIRCAVLVLGDGRAVNVYTEWLNKKRTEYRNIIDNDNEQESEEPNEENIDNEQDFIEEQRMLDAEYKTARIKQRKKKESEMRNVIQSLAVFSLNDYEESNKNNGGWQIQREERRKQRHKIRKEIMKNDVMTEQESLDVKLIHNLTLKNRWRLYRFWVKCLRVVLRKDIHRCSALYNRTAKQLSELKREEDFEVLRRADVIGLTTTGAAKYRDILYKIPVKTVIVEEAAEVLEAHIITAMPPTTEHLILIGDHQQLQPSPTVYELATKYNLNISLFERMIKNGIPFTKLSLQHRMRPQIADLIRPNIYKELADDVSVTTYEDVKGIKKNVFFVAHEVEEQSVLDGKSKVNQHEADFLAALCQHLLCQGYSPDQITILAAYTGQLFAFKNIMKKNFSKKVRVTAVDNFQGEENDIILLSLVRSNDQGKIGFLSVKNRVCVALSRAKMGLYCIANFKMLEENNSLWQAITGPLKKEGCYGASIPLNCYNHPDFVRHVKDVKDFKLFPEGGCGKPCIFRLQCGHVCTRSCHADDQEHSNFKCRKPCIKKCEKGHQCQKLCWQSCGECTFKVKKIIPSCQHEISIQCYKDPSKAQCTYSCLKYLTCGHKCKKLCGEKCLEKCQEKVEVQLICGHKDKLDCCQTELNAKEMLQFCSNICGETLKCGHKCKGTCGLCQQGRLHIRCKDKCTRINLCGHPCKENCSKKCPPCEEMCQTRCEHSECKEICSVPCAPCKEKCLWKCEHQHCGNLCSDACNVKPCNEPCKKLLEPCGHLCIGLCGEPCPKLCRICNEDDVTDIFFGDEDEKDAKFVELECGHIFTYENLDRWMYQDSDNAADNDRSIQLKECPKCKTVIRRSRRYGNIVNEQMKLINQVKELKDGSRKDILRLQTKLKRSIQDKDLQICFGIECVHLKKKLEIRYLGVTSLNVIETQIEVLKKLVSFKKEPCMRKIETGDLRKWLFRQRPYFSDQEILDIDCEVKRIEAIGRYHVLLGNVKELAMDNGIVDHYMSTIKTEFVENCKRYDDDLQDKVNRYFNDLRKINGDLFMGFEKATRNMIIKAMGFAKGHWYKCKNGHIYAIGDCGGATQQSKCPECNEVIGGTSHQLTGGNAVATEMDGATRGAYDEAVRINLVPENINF